MLFLGAHRPVINYSVEIYLVPHKHALSSNGVYKEFTISKKDLPVEPFILDDEIVLYDTSSYSITFSKEAAKRMGSLKPSIAVGMPFVLTVDREPILSGYVINSVSSYGCAAYVLTNTGQLSQKLGKGLPEKNYKKLIAEKRKNFLLVQALERTGRLK